VEKSLALQTALNGLESIAAEFRHPDDDFAAIAIIEAGDGEMILVPAYEWMDDARKQEFFEDYMPRAVHTHKAQRVVYVMSAWALQTDEWDAGDTRPSDSPDRYEIVIVTDITADGVVADFVSHINRDPFGNEPPTLGEFENMSENKSATHGGRAIDRVLIALKEVRKNG
jgi:hypothetical protein